MPDVVLVPSPDIDRLVPLLHEAEEGDDRIMAALKDSATTAYIARANDVDVGAVAMQWNTDESEIIYIATVPAVRGRGYGKAIIARVFDEARRRGVKAIIVGTANSSWPNIVFYQKCGFRMHAVRKDFFNYLPEPLFEDGIQMQDMLVLRCSIGL